MNAAGKQSTREDAERRVAELEAVRRALWDDRDDPMVMSELSIIQSQLRAAQEALR